jgi:replication factor A1
MHRTKDEVYGDVKDIMSPGEFTRAIHERVSEYNHLIDEDTIALLLADEWGRNKQGHCIIADLKPSMECTVEGDIIYKGEERQFTRKNGTLGKVLNLTITDGTGSCGLVLWDKDVELAQSASLGLKSKVKIINGYVKEGRNGLELNVGRWSVLKILKESQGETIQPLPSPETTIQGYIEALEPTRVFFKDSGDIGFVTTLLLVNDEGDHCITLWDEKVKDIQRFKKGDSIRIEQISLRNRNGSTELHVNGQSTITSVQQPP